MQKIVYLLLWLSFVSQASEQLKKTLLERLAAPKIILGSAYLDSADVKGSKGSVQVFKNRLMINNAFIGFSYTNWSFNWDNVADLPFGDGQSQPIEQMHGLSLDLRVPYRINDVWFTLSSLSVRSTFEKSPESSFGFGIFSFGSYSLSDDHTFQVGAFANYHPVSTLVLPVISYSYRARKRNGTKVVFGFPRTYVGYHINDVTLLRLGGIYSQSVIRLGDESTISASGFIEAKDYMGNVGFTYVPIETIELKADILYAFRRNFITYTSDGATIDSYSIEPSPGVDLKLIWWL